MPASTAGIIFNELHLPTATSTSGMDANNDGLFDNNDNAVELYNDGSTSTLITGWELWYVPSDGSPAHQLATLGPAIIPPGGHYTIVESTSAFVDTSNVGAGEEADASFVTSNTSVYALYNPNANEYIVVAGLVSQPLSITTLADAILAAHPVATLSGPVEYYSNTPPNNPATVQRETDGSDTWEVHDATLGAANCFLAGTLIATPDGEIAIEDLGIGDYVRTAEGGNTPVLWVGRQTIRKRFWRERAQLVRIRAGALGTHSDLYVTADHGMILKGFIVNASALVNGSTINFVPLDETPERQTVYHIETRAHDVVFANGAASETYLDLPGRSAFDNFGDYLDLYGSERTIQENPMPRISAPRLLPAALSNPPRAQGNY